MGKQGPCRHCGVTSELLFFNKARVFIFLFFSCFSPFPFCSSASSTFRVMISPNYAYGNRDLDEIFGLRGTRIHLSVFLMCSLKVISTLNSLNCQECS